jgi:hypothetical protein
LARCQDEGEIGIRDIYTLIEQCRSDEGFQFTDFKPPENRSSEIRVESAVHYFRVNAEAL